MKNIIITVSLIFCFMCSFSVFSTEQLSSVSETYLKFDLDVYKPDGKLSKFPVIFVAHNGGSTKEQLEDYPKTLSQNGYFVVAFSWDGNRSSYDLEQSIKYVLKKYADNIDTERVALIGGCRGGANAIALLSKQSKLNLKIKTVIVLSVSEKVSDYPELEKGATDIHPSILAYYSLKDRLGEKYQAISKKFAEEILMQPKTVIALDATPHGHELLTNPETKDQVRKEINEWLKKYL
jgi:dienelactone hydrolase